EGEVEGDGEEGDEPEAGEDGPLRAAAGGAAEPPRGRRGGRPGGRRPQEPAEQEQGSGHASSSLPRSQALLGNAGREAPLRGFTRKAELCGARSQAELGSEGWRGEGSSQLRERLGHRRGE